MKLSVSNIAWTKEEDTFIYALLKKLGYQGLEIAPTRFFPTNPYEHLNHAKDLALELKSNYNLIIPSLQSIWYGRDEKVFGAKKDQDTLIDYTNKVMIFAKTIGAYNLVFGSPRNRIISKKHTVKDSYDFFLALGDKAKEQQCYLAIEANPEIYNTNFINTTQEAFDLVKKLEHPNIKVNIDLGTVIENKESLTSVSDNINFVSHIHISEPYLEPIKERSLHQELASLLREQQYKHFVSIEMKSGCGISKLTEILCYVQEVFQ